MIKLDFLQNSQRKSHLTTLDQMISRKHYPTIPCRHDTVSDVMIRIRYRVSDCVWSLVKIIDGREL